MASQLAGAGIPDADFAEHVATYRLFTNGVKYGGAAVVIFLIILAFLTL
jgi:hypothetical protein